MVRIAWVCILCGACALALSGCSKTKENYSEWDMGDGYWHVEVGGESLLHAPGAHMLYYGSRERGGRLVWPYLSTVGGYYDGRFYFQGGLSDRNPAHEYGLFVIEKPEQPAIEIVKEAVRIASEKDPSIMKVPEYGATLADLRLWGSDGLKLLLNCSYADPEDARLHGTRSITMTWSELEKAIEETKKHGVKRRYGNVADGVPYIAE